MGTRTEIMKIASSLEALASRNPAISRDLQQIVVELKATAERADKKRMERKNAIKGLLTTLQRPNSAPAMGPRPNFLSTAVVPKLTDRALAMQLMEYEKSMNLLMQTMSNVQRDHAAAIASVANNLR